jgi:hypothetical protein
VASTVKGPPLRSGNNVSRFTGAILRANLIGKLNDCALLNRISGHVFFSQAKWDAVVLTMRIGGLEMTTKKLRKAATAAERKAMTVSTQEFEFVWTNRE